MPDKFDDVFPGGVEECVATLSDEPSVDDPEELCNWLRENGFERLAEADEEVQEVLLNLSVEYVSVVDEPAQPSEWLLAKSADADPDEFNPEDDPLHTGEFVLKKAVGDEEDEEDEDEPERKVWAAVLVPGAADRHGDMIPEPEIESAAHDYLKTYRKVDSDHNLLDGSGVPIESYIVRNGPEEFTLPNGETREYPVGTWIMGVELSETAWKRVEDGELTGFSIYGGAASLDPDALLSEEVAQAIKSYRERNSNMEENQVAKASLSDEEAKRTLQSLQEDVVSVVEDVNSLKSAVEFDDEPDDEDGDDESDDETEDEEQGDDQKSKSETTDMGDEPTNDDETDETNDKLDRILKSVEDTEETVTEVKKSVSSVEDRVSDLENEVYEKDADEETETEETETETEETEKNADEEGDYLTRDEAEELVEDTAESTAEKAVEKALGDDEENEEVVRKSDKTPSDDATETAGGPSINVSNAGVLGGGD